MLTIDAVAERLRADLAEARAAQQRATLVAEALERALAAMLPSVTAAAPAVAHRETAAVPAAEEAPEAALPVRSDAPASVAGETGAAGDGAVKIACTINRRLPIVRLSITRALAAQLRWKEGSRVALAIDGDRAVLLRCRTDGVRLYAKAGRLHLDLAGLASRGLAAVPAPTSSARWTARGSTLVLDRPAWLRAAALPADTVPPGWTTDEGLCGTEPAGPEPDGLAEGEPDGEPEPAKEPEAEPAVIAPEPEGAPTEPEPERLRPSPQPAPLGRPSPTMPLRVSDSLGALRERAPVPATGHVPKPRLTEAGAGSAATAAARASFVDTAPFTPGRAAEWLRRDGFTVHEEAAGMMMVGTEIVTIDAMVALAERRRARQQRKAG